MRWRRRKRSRRTLWKIVFAAGVFLVLGKTLMMAQELGIAEKIWGEEREEAFFTHLWNRLYPAPEWEGEEGDRRGYGRAKGSEYAEQVRKLTQVEEDPAYRTVKAAEAFFQEHQYLEIYGGEETNDVFREEMENDSVLAEETRLDKGAGLDEKGEIAGEHGGTGSFAAASSGIVYPGKLYSLAQLEDYDFLMKHFYNVHTSTTAGRELMDAKKFLSRDFRLEKGEEHSEETPDTSEAPQILIYHTHSQEAFAGSREGETIVAVGEYLAQCLTERGFSVYHDSSAYDVHEGKLDRNKAYSYALEGLTEILEKNPSIQVVIDLHRDGVGANTHLVTEVNGKPTAQIMFFNGTSQTPEGPVPYLENPYREDNLAFSLQLQLKAAAWYPGFTRKIYLKGLRYNQHLRPRSCLIEVGAQTNTYEEARNAMEPLADIFARVLRGN